MPVLDLGSNSEKALSEPVYYGDKEDFLAATVGSPAGFRVGAVMHYPDEDSEAKRRGYVANRVGRVMVAIQEERDRHPEGSGVWRHYNRIHQAWKDGAFEPLGGLKPLFQAHPADMKPRPKASQGDYAGHMLLRILERAERCPEEAGVNKACEYLEIILLKPLERGDKPQTTKLATSRAHIPSAWSHFKPVAHLWGAHVLWQIDAGRCGGCQTTLGAFLATAEELRQRGEQLHPLGRKTAKSQPVLDPERTWRVPPGLTLPTVSISLPQPRE